MAKECNRHSRKHLIDASSVLCAHPECIKRLTHSLSKRSNALQKLFKIIEVHQAQNDMVGYIVERLLIEKAEGKPVILNVSWLFFTLNRFVRDEMIQFAIEDELQQITEEVPESYSGWYKRCNTITPEQILVGKDLLAWVSEEYSEPYVLYLSGFISKTDLMKLTETTPVILDKVLKNLQQKLLKE
jgi:hypothetical protein|tara:strand:+ start:675 stop:1232 length:558 start_codon:yes stop_codon:yes gene_type:complete